MDLLNRKQQTISHGITECIFFVAYNISAHQDILSKKGTLESIDYVAYHIEL